jgi:hypothetical protein
LALVCNIDQQGRSVRYRIGAVLSALGLALGLGGSLLAGGKWPWFLGAPLVAAGLFSLFEASRGWCAMRALGFKTRV